MSTHQTSFPVTCTAGVPRSAASLREDTGLRQQPTYRAQLSAFGRTLVWAAFNMFCAVQSSLSSPKPDFVLEIQPEMFASVFATLTFSRNGRGFIIHCWKEFLTDKTSTRWVLVLLFFSHASMMDHSFLSLHFSGLKFTFRILLSTTYTGFVHGYV